VVLPVVLTKLGINPEDMQRAPRVSAILSGSYDGLPGVLQALRISDDPDITQFLQAYDAATVQDREILPWEAFCLMAKVEPKRFLGAALVAMREHSVAAVKAIAFSAHPRTMQARVDQAMLPGGVRDRNALDTALRFLPAPKGPTLIAMPGSTITAAELHDDGEEAPGDPDFLFPDLSETQKLIGK